MSERQTEHMLLVAERIKKHESRGGKGELVPYQLEYNGIKEDFLQSVMVIEYTEKSRILIHKKR